MTEQDGKQGDQRDGMRDASDVGRLRTPTPTNPATTAGWLALRDATYFGEAMPLDHLRPLVAAFSLVACGDALYKKAISYKKAIAKRVDVEGAVDVHLAVDAGFDEHVHDA